jgi:hypothetical protein
MEDERLPQSGARHCEAKKRRSDELYDSNQDHMYDPAWKNSRTRRID